MRLLQRLIARVTEPEPPPARRFDADDDTYIQYLRDQREKSAEAVRQDWLDRPVVDRFRGNREGRE